MLFLNIFIYIICAVILIIGLLISGSGSTGGIAQLSGQDLEIFKKTKDYGLIKILKIIMFLLTILLLVLSVVAQKI